MSRLVIFLLLFLGGCNFKPNYTRPEMSIGEKFRFEPENSEAYANVAWWDQFQDPELNRIIQIALANNQDLKVATGRVLEFYAKYGVAFSELLPQVGASGDVDRIKLSESVNFQPPIVGVPRINDLYSFLLKFSYELDFWGKIRNSAEAARSVYLEQVYARSNVILTLVSSVAASYIFLKQYNGQLEVSKLTYESRRRSWDIAIDRFKGGLVSEQDVKQAESEALIAEVQIKNFEILVAKQEDLLSVLLGQTPGPISQGVLLKDLVLPPSIPAGLPSDLLANRPDILQAEERIFAANAEIGVARSAFFPSFSLTGDFGQRTTFSKLFFDDSATLFRLGLQAFQPLFTGLRLTNELKESEAVLYQALHAYQQTILVALQEVDDALIEYQKSLEKYELQKQRVAASKQYLYLANLRYFNGQNDYLTVLDAEKALFTSQLQKVKTDGDLYLSLIALYKALGQGWDIEEEMDAQLDENSSQSVTEDCDS